MRKCVITRTIDYKSCCTSFADKKKGGLFEVISTREFFIVKDFSNFTGNLWLFLDEEENISY